MRQITARINITVRYELSDKSISDAQAKEYFARVASEDVFGEDNWSNYFEVEIKETGDVHEQT